MRATAANRSLMSPRRKRQLYYGQEGLDGRKAGQAHPALLPCFPPALLPFLSFLPLLPVLEPVPERQLPDPHEPGLRRNAPEARAVDGVRVDAVELRRVRQVEDLEANLARLGGGETHLLGEH